MTEKTENLEKIILTEIYKNPSFIACDVEGITPAQTEKSGEFESIFFLSDLHLWSGLTSKELFKIGKIEEKSDTLLLKILDRIAEEGKVQIYRAEISHNMSVRDFRFKAVIGEGKRTAGTSDVIVTVVRHFGKEPLSKKEIEKRKCLVNLSEIVKEIRENRDVSFRQTMGEPSSASLVNQQKEAMITQKNSMKEEQEFRENIAIIADWIKSEKEDDKNAKNRNS